MEADDLKKDSNLKKAEINSSKKKIPKKEIGGQDGPEKNCLLCFGYMAVVILGVIQQVT